MGANFSCDDPNYPDKDIIARKCYKKCPDGFVHLPLDFSKCVLANGPQPYGRDVGSPLVCPDGKVNENGSCYTPCQKGLKGNKEKCEWDIRDIGPPK